MEGGNIPSPDFDAKPSGFLQFSSTPVGGKQFKPKFGKKNRQDNWKRFGQNQREENGESRSPGYRNPQEFGQSPGGMGTPPPWSNGQTGGFGSPRGNFGTPRGNFGTPHRGYNGSPRGNFGTPRGNYGSPRGGNFGGPRGNYGNFDNGTPNRGEAGFRGASNRNNSFRGGSNNSNSNNGLFHPSMIEDPWRQLESQRSGRSNSSYSTTQGSNSTLNSTQGSNSTNSLVSDSMIPQVGDSLVFRNNALNDSQISTSSQQELET